MTDTRPEALEEAQLLALAAATKSDLLMRRQDTLLRELHQARTELVEHEVLLKRVDAWRKLSSNQISPAEHDELLDLLSTADNSLLLSWDRDRRIEVLQEAVDVVLSVIDDEVLASPTYARDAAIFELAIAKATARLVVIRDRARPRG